MKTPSLVGIFIALGVWAAITESATTSPTTSSKAPSTRTSTTSSRTSTAKVSGTTSSTLSLSIKSKTGPSSSKPSSSKSSSISTKPSTLSSRTSSTSSTESSTASKTSSTSSLKSTSTQSLRSSLSSTVKSSTTSKSSSTVWSGSSSTSSRSPSGTKTSSVVTTVTTSTSARGTPSIALVTPTGCPWISTGSLIWQNATSETAAVGIFGTLDQYGYPATATRIGIWNGSRINSTPDVIIDITNPAMLMASVTKDLHSIVLDTANSQMHVSNCSIEAIVPLPPPTKKRRTTRKQTASPPRPAPQIARRQVSKPAGSIQVTITYNTPCGQPDQWQSPDVDCGNATPGLWPNTIAPVSQVVQTAPGVYSTTCYFPDVVDGRKDSPLCQTIYPLLTEICKINDATSAPLTGGILEAYCLYLAATIILEELAAICAIFVGALGLYCMVQTEFNGGVYGNGFHDALCGPDVSSTDLSVRVTSGFPHDTWYNPALDLGTQNSAAPKNIAVTVPNKVSAGATCTPCKNSNQQWLTPWVQVYAGNMFLRNDFGCSGYWYYGYLGDSSTYSFGSAQAQCQIIAENNLASVWYADSETFTYNDGNPTSGPYFGCWVTGCEIQASDFTLDFNVLNPSTRSFIVEDVVAFHRTVEWVNCVS